VLAYPLGLTCRSVGCSLGCIRFTFGSFTRCGCFPLGLGPLVVQVPQAYLVLSLELGFESPERYLKLFGSS
jgi:hypothetical protein